jgi:hypothetical protein
MLLTTASGTTAPFSAMSGAVNWIGLVPFRGLRPADQAGGRHQRDRGGHPQHLSSFHLHFVLHSCIDRS